MKQRIQKTLGSIITLFAVFFAIPIPADALFFLGPMAVAAIAYAVLYILQFIGSMLFSLASYFVSIILNFNFMVLDSTNSVVTIGWEITRDIANLGFVLVIIVIALATIVRYQDYGAKKLLPRLIGAALLVNFSLSIAGVFIGFSHVITKYFMGAVTNSGSSQVSGFMTTEFTETLAGAFNPQNLFTEPEEPEPVDPDEEAGGLSGFSSAVLMNISSLAFTVVFIYIAAFVLFAFAIMLLIRYVALSILMVMAPIAWLFWVIPSLSDQFSKWWSKFMKWVFFAPAVSFFFYLALVSIDQMNKGMGAVSKTQFFKNGFIAAMAQQGVRMLILVGFLIGGLLVADSMGTTGAKGAIGMLKTGSDKAKKWVAGKAKESAGAAGRRVLTKGTDGEGKTTLNRLASRLEGNKIAKYIPGATGIARKLSVASSQAQATGKKNVDEEKKKFDNWTKEDLAAETKSILSSGNIDDITARGLALAEKGGLDMLDNSAQERVIDAVRRTKKGDDMLIHAPQLYKKFAKSEKPEDISAKGKEIAAKLDKLPKGNKSPEFKQFLSDYAQYLNQGIIDQVGSTSIPNGDELRTAIKTSLKTHAPKHADVEKYRADAKALTEDIESLATEIEEKQAEMEATTDQTMKDALKQTIKDMATSKRKLATEKKTANKEIEKIKDGLSADERRAFDKLENINKQPNYRSTP